MGNSQSFNNDEDLKNWINNNFKDFVNENILSFYDDLTSVMDLESLEMLKNMDNFDWVENYLAIKSNSNKQIINSLIDYKISKEMKKRKNFGNLPRSKRRSLKRKII